MDNQMFVGDSSSASDCSCTNIPCIHQFAPINRHKSFQQPHIHFIVDHDRVSSTIIAFVVISSCCNFKWAILCKSHQLFAMYIARS
jgi:hypothetical protein